MRCVQDLFSEQALRTPDAVALSVGAQHLTYAQLEERASQLALYLHMQGLGPDQLVAVFVERSVDLVIALLGVLKSGTAYLPIDPAQPRDRIDFILKNARPHLVLSQEAMANALPPEAPPVVLLDSQWNQISAHASAAEPYALPRHPFPANLAYVIYTSGSTGRPKGVMVQHDALMNCMTSMREQIGLAEADKLLAITTVSFDIATLEIFLPLICGARLVLASQDEARDATRLMKLLEDEQITVMQATPATWQLLVSADWSGRRELQALCGGEALPTELASKLLDRVGELWNLYGPTETTIWSCARQVNRSSTAENQVESLGHPIHRTQVYVLDEQLEPAPFGVAGELYIAGAGLARGYVTQAGLTAERFVANPFGGHRGDRLYRSGDVVRLQRNHTIEYLGRNDDQVKIRGFRIEPGEVESQLMRHSMVRQAVVVAQEDREGQKYLAAYVIPQSAAVRQDNLILETLRAHAASVLPSYMAPSAWMLLERFPLTPNGKINRRALPAATIDADRPYEAPQGSTEAALALIWQDLLGVTRVGRDDNFFELGGQSLHVMRLVTQISERLMVAPRVPEVFRHPTIRKLAGLIAQSRSPDSACPVLQKPEFEEGVV